MMKVNTNNLAAVVLAGSFNRIKLYDGYKPGYKALLSFNGRTSIEYTLAALQAEPRIRSICIVGDEKVLRPAICQSRGDCPFDFVPLGKNLIQSLNSGLGHYKDAACVLVATEDMPLVTAESVKDFLDACEQLDPPYEQNLYASFVPREAYTGPYAGVTKTFNRFRNVSVVHGNLALIEPNLTRNIEFAAKLNNLYEGRKNWRLQLNAVGFRLAMAYTFGAFLLPVLSLDRMAKIVSWRFKVGFNPVLVNHPEITVDIDEPKDYKFVSKMLEQQAAHP
jgi:CTP:molybdopterin cytidylyltransferase MocA